MNRLLALGVGALLFAAASTFAQNPKAPGTNAQPAGAPVMPMMAQMDEHLKKMQALHETMISASTPEERQKAMEGARKEMQDSMRMMKPMMQGGGMMEGGMMGQKGKSSDTDAQMQMISKRMDMMQMMMQMMLDQQAVMGPPKASDAVPTK